ncbi:MAG: hypothetical protein IV107_07425 [Paucibacter sp.]|nr:hypothetical protein [Roseateles sp.]
MMKSSQLMQISQACGLGMAALLLSACASTVQPIAMTPQQGFGGQSEALVAGHRSSASGVFADESFELGLFRVAEVKRDLWASSNSVGLGPLTFGKTSSGFSYVLQGPDERLLGRCEVRNGETRLPLWGNQIPLQAKFRLLCDCQGGQTSAHLDVSSDTGWQNVDAWLPNRLELSINGQSFSGSPFDHRGFTINDGRAFVGYRFDGQAGPAAAVGVFSPGQVWLHQQLPSAERAAMNCALAGLLLHFGP